MVSQMSQIEILVSKIQFHLKGKYFAPNVATVNQTQDCASKYPVKNLQIAFNEINNLGKRKSKVCCLPMIGYIFMGKALI